MYPCLDYHAFGRQLFETEDLDPVYVMLYKAHLPRPLLARWLLAYWCFYHSGLCCYAAEAPEHLYWDRLEEIVKGKYPRGTERRHFRGQKALESIHYLRAAPNAETLLDLWFGVPIFSSVEVVVRQAPLFGPWIAFKVADMGERVWGAPISFADCYLRFYIEPLKGAALILTKLPEITKSVKMFLPILVRRLLREFNQYKAPPVYDRPINVQEIETILCKYKSHWAGHYPLGKDTRELRHSLEGWGDLAEELSKHVPTIASH